MPGGTDSFRGVLCRSASFPGCGAPGGGVEVPGIGDAGSAFDLDAVGPGDAEPVAAAAACVELAGLDPVVDDSGAAPEAPGRVGDADLAGGVGVRRWDLVGVADPLDGCGVEGPPVAG